MSAIVKTKSNRNVINIKSLIINIIYYLVFIAIFSGMLRVTNDYSKLNSVYTLTKMMCLLFCFIYFILFFRKLNNKTILFLILFLFYVFIITFVTMSFNIPNGIIDIMLWPILIITFYDYTIAKGDYQFIKKSISIFYLLIVLISLYLTTIHLMGHGYGKTGYVIFPTYFLLSTLPLVLKFKSKKVGRIFLIGSILLLMITTKRTGFLIALVGALLYFISSIQISDDSKVKLKRYIQFILIGFIVLIVVYMLFQTQIESILSRFNQISEDEGSGRLDIWNYIFTSFGNSNIISKIFGHGTQSVMYSLQPFGRSIFAHNSFIEYLYDYGFIGLGLLVIFNIKILKFIHTARKNKDSNYPILIYIFVVILFLSILSYFFEQSFIILPIAIILGIFIGEGGCNDKSKYNSSSI